MVILPHSWEENYTNPKSMPLTHEFGHVWDASTGNLSLQGIVGGVADQLNTYIGGTVVEQNGSRFAGGSGNDYIPDNYIWKSDFNGNYGNNSTADYLCETFNALIYEPDAIPAPLGGVGVGGWVKNIIKQQADTLTPPVIPEAIRAPHAPASTPTPSHTPSPPLTPNTPTPLSTGEMQPKISEPK